MAEISEIIVSVIILFFVLFGIYNKFLKGKAVLPVSAKTLFGKIKGIYGGKIKKPQITIWYIAKLAILAIAAVVVLDLYQDVNGEPGAAFSFSAVNSSLGANWEIVSGTWTEQNGCLVGSGEIKLKNPNIVKYWKKVEFFPPTFGSSCGAQSLNGLNFQIGDIIYTYRIGSPPDKKDRQNQYHSGSMYFKEIKEDSGHIFASRDSKMITKGKEGPYPVGIIRKKWYQYTEPRLKMFVCYTDEPLCTRVLSYSNGLSRANEEGGLIISSDKKIGIGGIKVYY